MATELFKERSFSTSSLHIIEQANAIIVEYQSQGFVLTLRQLYYQFVARDLIGNNQKNYKRIGSIVNDARIAGLIDWEAIEDRTRNLRTLPSWGSPEEIVETCARQFRTDPWDSQPTRVEVWIEKDALIGVIEPTCNKYSVPYFACRGYSSQSELYRAGKRLAEYTQQGQSVVVLHLGDHDPSGIDMTRDNEERLCLFSRENIEVRRLALNIAQVKKWKPPPNPAKMTDARATDYVSKFGPSSWELDALDPTKIAKLLEDEFATLIDTEEWDAAQAKSAAGRASLSGIVSNWAKVEKLVARP